MGVALILTSRYRRDVQRLLEEDERLAMEESIASAPAVHPVIPGTGGVRKARWGRRGRGKRGGVRVIYYCVANRQAVLMIRVYAKSEQEDLSHAEKQAIHQAVENFERSQET